MIFLAPSDEYDELYMEQLERSVKSGSRRRFTWFTKKDIIDLTQKKHITWEDENINLKIIENESDDDNIFRKLKKITPQRDDLSNNNNIINRLNILEDKLEALNSKMDLIINLLSQ